MKKLILIALAVCAARLVSAAEVTAETATRAAEGFVTADAVGKVVLAGCTVDSVVARGRLWIAHLAPSGHVILSGSDLVDPIVGFSKNDFVEPDSESPAFAVLEGADASVAAREAQGGGTRHERWTKLLGGGGRKMLKAGAVEVPQETIWVPPFLESHYNQWQPYNDYAPVCNSATNTSLDRGRSPSGCVATAAVQAFRFFRWPVRIDRTLRFDHAFEGTNGMTTTFPIRFDGHVPVDWNALDDTYIEYSVVTNFYPTWHEWRRECDLRGIVAESVRYPIARLSLWTDVMARMSFKPEASSANYDQVASGVADWYTLGRWVDLNDDADWVKAYMCAGIPCQVELGAYSQDPEPERIGGHEVVANGWAEDGVAQYVYINFGFGGSNDGYYNIAESLQEYQEKRVYVGHFPRAKPQIDPLPKVSGPNVTLNWHFPDFYTNNLHGFSVAVSKTATAPSTFLDDFSTSEGVSTSDGIYVGVDGTYSYDGNLLYAASNTVGAYTFNGSRTLTSASVLTFKFLNYCANSLTYAIQASFDGGEWQTIYEPVLDHLLTQGSDGSWYLPSSQPSWRVERLFLGGHGGQNARFRIVKGYNWGEIYFRIGCILLDDFQVTNVLEQGAPTMYGVAASERNFVLPQLDDGTSYAFTVAPVISGALVEGEPSDPVAVVVAGDQSVPIPGEQLYQLETLSFSTSDSSGTWSYSGTAVDDTSVGGGWNCSITCIVSGEITPTSTLSFDWTADDYYGVYNDANSYDVLSATFTASDGTQSTIWSINNTSAKTSRQQVYCSLAALNGQTGKIVISYSHKGGGYNNGGVIYAPQITNALVPSVPAVAWNTETLTALGTPQIRSVSSTSEGFYRECGLGTTTFDVTCSESVTSLAAWPSHLALVNDDDVSVTPKGDGRFTVTVTPSGITEDNARSRLILTLAATDANGTTVYKDLSLRFEPVAVTASEVQVDITPADGGDSYSVSISYDWLETSGLVTPGSGPKAYEAALDANADADSDGLPNWAEYICGTSPTNANDKLTVTIRLEDGQPVVETSPTAVLDGFRAVKKGSHDLKTWTAVTETKTSPYHFFKVVIEPNP